jgi:hypothetical protein
MRKVIETDTVLTMIISTMFVRPGYMLGELDPFGQRCACARAVCDRTGWLRGTDWMTRDLSISIDRSICFRRIIGTTTTTTVVTVTSTAVVTTANDIRRTYYPLLRRGGFYRSSREGLTEVQEFS